MDALVVAKMFRGLEKAQMAQWNAAGYRQGVTGFYTDREGYANALERAAMFREIAQVFEEVAKTT
jgi:hypothetical protein